MAQQSTHSDAVSRSLRTFVTGLGVDCAIAGAALTQAQAGTITNRAALSLYAVALSKTLIQTAASYVLRFLAPPAAAAPVGGPETAAAASAPEVTAPPPGVSAVPSVPVQQVPPVS